MKPIYEHDCEMCQYEFSMKSGDQEGMADVYTHGKGRETHKLTVIVRYSSEPGDYASGTASNIMNSDHDLGRVARRLFTITRMKRR